MPVHVHMLEMIITSISKELHRETTRDHIIRPLIKMDLVAYYSYHSYHYDVKFFYNRSRYIPCSLF